MSDSGFPTLLAWLIEGQKTYISLKDCLDEFENEPDEHLRGRIEVTLHKMKEELDQLKSDNPELSFRLRMLNALIKYELGKILLWTSPEAASKYLNEARDTVEKNSSSPSTVLLAAGIMNELNALCFNMKYYDAANIYFAAAQNIWKLFEYDKYLYIGTLEDLFLSNDIRENQVLSPFEQSCNMYKVLKQSYSNSLARCWLQSIKVIIEEKDYEPLLWTTNLILLADMLIACQNFRAARHILSCAKKLMVSDKIEMLKKYPDENNEHWKKFHCMTARISNCWGHYALYLLQCSWIAKEYEETGATSEAKAMKSQDCKRAHRLLPKDEVKKIESKISCVLASNFKEAEKIFKFGKRQIETSQEYYAKHTNTDNYVSTIQIIRKMYEYVAYFVNDIEHKCELHVSAINMVGNKLKNLDPKLYPILHRNLIFNMANSYTCFAQLKQQLLNNISYCRPVSYTDPASESADIEFLLITDEMAHAVNEAIGYFMVYFTNFRVRNEDLVEFLSIDAAYVLDAYISMGNLYIMRPEDGVEVLENLERAEAIFKEISKYIMRTREHQKFVPKIQDINRFLAEVDGSLNLLSEIAVQQLS